MVRVAIYRVKEMQVAAVAVTIAVAYTQINIDAVNKV